MQRGKQAAPSEAGRGPELPGTISPTNSIRLPRESGQLDLENGMAKGQQGNAGADATSSRRPGREAAGADNGAVSPSSSGGGAGPATSSASGSGRRIWTELLRSRDFMSVCLVNAALFASANGGRGLIMPLAAMEGFSWSPGETGGLLSFMASFGLGL